MLQRPNVRQNISQRILGYLSIMSDLGTQPVSI